MRLFKGIFNDKQIGMNIKTVSKYILSFLICLAFAGIFFHDWDGFVLITSAEHFLQGITPYEISQSQVPYTFAPYPPYEQQWYAYPPLPLLLYTPFYAIFHFSPLTDPIIARILIKIPFILGNLLCAYLVFKLISQNSTLENAKKAETLILFNPFLIFISAIWGMFDIWIVNFILLGVLCLSHNKWSWSGICFGLACLVKPIPIILAPLFLAYIWTQTKSITKMMTFLIFTVGTLILISLPFWLRSPEGYLMQTIGMHLDRAAQGFSLFNLTTINESIKSLFGIEFLSDTVVNLLSSFGLVLLAIAIGASFLYYLRRENGSISILLGYITMLIIIFLATNKVVNPQYYVLPIVFLLSYYYSSDNHWIIDKSQILRLYRFLLVPVTISSILIGYHFLMFIPPDIALHVFGQPVGSIITQLSQAGPSVGFSNGVVFLISFILVSAVPAVLMLPSIIYGWKLSIQWLNSMFVQVEVRRVTQLTVPVSLVLLIFSTLVLPIGLIYNKIESPALAKSSLIEQDGKLVGTVYYYWWNNSSHNPSIKYDSWENVKLTPREGYYESTYSFMQEDIKQMKTAGIDFALLSFHNYGLERYTAFADAAEGEHFLFAPMIELQDVTSNPNCIATSPDGHKCVEKRLAFTDDTKAQFIELLDRALSSMESKAFLKFDNKPVVFLYDSFYFYPGWSTNETEYMVESLLELYKQKNNCDTESAFRMISETWNVNITCINDLICYYPKDIGVFYSQLNVIESDWNKAFQYSWHRFWGDIQEEIEQEYGDVFWIGGDYTRWWTPEIYGNTPVLYFETFDAEFVYSPSFVWLEIKGDKEQSSQYWEKQMNLLAQYSSDYEAPIIQTVTPYYDDRLIRPETGFEIPLMLDDSKYSYDIFWEIALSNDPDIILISTWNEYYESSCIESTQEFGEFFLEKTKHWCEIYKNDSFISIGK